MNALQSNRTYACIYDQSDTTATMQMYRANGMSYGQTQQYILQNHAQIVVVRSFLIRIPLWLVPYKYQSISEAKGTIIQIHTRKMLLNITYLPSKFPTSQQRLGLLL